MDLFSSMGGSISSSRIYIEDESGECDGGHHDHGDGDGDGGGCGDDDSNNTDEISHVFSSPDFVLSHLWLVVWNMAFMTFHIVGIIIPTDFHIFQRGLNHQPYFF